MKKLQILFLITILSFSFFACASSTKSDEELPENDVLEQVTEDITKTEDNIDENLEDTTPVSKELTEETLPVVEDTIEEQENYKVNELEDIVEPVVIDIIDFSEEKDTEDNPQIEENTDNSELINPDDLDELPFEDLTLEIFQEPEVEVIEPENTTDTVVEVETTETPNESINDFEDIILEEPDSSENNINVFENEGTETVESADIIDVISENEEANQEEENIVPEIIPSRSVELKKGEYLDVIYPGTGWVYVGLIDGSKDITYNGRRLGTTNTTFTLIAKKEGTFIVHFYKIDTLTGDYIDDYLEIKTTGEKTTSKVHKIAPDYSGTVPPKPRTVEEIVAEKQLENEIKETENADTATVDAITPLEAKKIEEVSEPAQRMSYIQEAQKNPETTEKKSEEKPTASFNTNKTPQKQNKKQSVPKVQSEDDDIEVLDKGKPDLSSYDTVDTEALLEQAYKAYNEKSFADALKYITDFISISSKKIDEAYYLKGQIYEAQSGIQNINNAVKAYETVINNYPASKYWDKANKRIIYLKRFYLEVR